MTDTIQELIPDNHPGLRKDTIHGSQAQPGMVILNSGYPMKIVSIEREDHPNDRGPFRIMWHFVLEHLPGNEKMKNFKIFFGEDGTQLNELWLPNDTVLGLHLPALTPADTSCPVCLCPWSGSHIRVNGSRFSCMGQPYKQRTKLSKEDKAILAYFDQHSPVWWPNAPFYGLRKEE